MDSDFFSGSFVISTMIQVRFDLAKLFNCTRKNQCHRMSLFSKARYVLATQLSISINIRSICASEYGRDITTGYLLVLLFMSLGGGGRGGGGGGGGGGGSLTRFKTV